MKRSAVLSCLLFFMLSLSAQIYGREDSVRVCNLLREFVNGDDDDVSDSSFVVRVASRFIGVPYVAATLDARCGKECLTVNVDSVDCTTFVEYVVACCLTIKQQSVSFGAFCDNLRMLRYRDGCIEDYTSRLHYFSDWVNDNNKRGVLDEVCDGPLFVERKICLNFMTNHVPAYKALTEHPELVGKMGEAEKRYADYGFRYIPKEYLLKRACELPVRDGDIVALVTSVAGLDVSHLGFALWVGDSLHLLNASSVAGRVQVDRLSLYDYMDKRKSALGIRVVRVK